MYKRQLLGISNVAAAVHDKVAFGAAGKTAFVYKAFKNLRHTPRIGWTDKYIGFIGMKQTRFTLLYPYIRTDNFILQSLR